MTWQWIDMANSPRKAHFDYFRTLQNPMVGVTAEVDVPGLEPFTAEPGRHTVRVAQQTSDGR